MKGERVYATPAVGVADGTTDLLGELEVAAAAHATAARRFYAAERELGRAVDEVRRIKAAIAARREAIATGRADQTASSVHPAGGNEMNPPRILAIETRALDAPAYARLGHHLLRHDGLLIEVVPTAEAPDAPPWQPGGVFDVDAGNERPLDEPALLALIESGDSAPGDPR